MKVVVFGPGKCSRQIGGIGQRLGRGLVESGHVVINGGYAGFMAAVSRGANKAGGKAVGVVIRGVGKPNRYLTRIVERPSLAKRQAELLDMGEAYIALPGGSGTSSEILDALNIEAKREKLSPGSPAKPIILLSADEAEWDRTLGWLHEAAGEAVAGLLLLAHTPEFAVWQLTAG